MVKHFDHVTVAVEELEESIKFFERLGFVVDDIEKEVKRLTQAGVKLRNKIMTFNRRKLVFFYGQSVSTKLYTVKDRLQRIQHSV